MDIQAHLNRFHPRLVAAAAIALVLIGGSAFGAAGDPAPATYYGCLTPGGTLQHIVVNPDDEPDCPGNEQLISWNELGPPGPQGLQGEQGDPGDDGAQGDPGQDGAPGVSGYEIVSVVVERSEDIPTLIFGEATCSPGKQILGGGYDTIGVLFVPLGDVGVIKNAPGASGTSWDVRLFDDPTDPAFGQLRIFAICANVAD
ncbi:MAG TPA: hypothetical protein VMM78_00165 [Thermomicrobiales bacterium]|nr:hypothetical protein [Thermomicrobiales bacterium]